VTTWDGGLQIEVTEAARSPKVTIRGEIDLVSSGDVRSALAPLLTADVERIDLDLTDVSFLDSSGLSALIEAANAVPVHIVGASTPVRRIVEATGLDEVLGLQP
jgi:anti-sigma B factor antagonist